MTIAPETIGQIAAELQDYPVPAERAGELAVEVGRINGRVVGAAAAQLGFFDEPSQFIRILESLREAGE